MLDGQTHSQFPQVEGDPLTDPIEGTELSGEQDSASQIEILWEQIAHVGLTEPVIRFGTHAFLVVLVLTYAQMRLARSWVYYEAAAGEMKW